MKISVLQKQDINLKYAKCEIEPGYWEDAMVNGQEDDLDNPTIPCVENNLWCPIIGLDTGQIINWKQGIEADVYYKSRDCNKITFVDVDGNIVKVYDGYVPNFLHPNDNASCGDYIGMIIDKDGYIQDFNNDLSDIFD